jgi:hypothetical protein
VSTVLEIGMVKGNSWTRNAWISVAADSWTLDLQRGNVRKVAQALSMVESVPDGEAVRDLETHVADGQVYASAFRLCEKGADFE